MVLATNVKNYKYKLWVKILCLVLSVMLVTSAAAHGILTVYGLGYSFSPDENGFLNSGNTVMSLTSDARTTIYTALNRKKNSEDYLALQEAKEEVIASVLEEYEENLDRYTASLESEDYYGEYDGTEETTSAYSDRLKKYISRNIEIPSGTVNFTIRYDEIYNFDINPRMTVERAYDEFSYPYMPANYEYTNNLYNNISVTQALYLNGEPADETCDVNGALEDELKRAEDNGIYYIYNNGEVSYDTSVFSEETANSITYAVEHSLNSTQNAAYFLYINMDMLYASAKNNYFNYASVFSYPGDELITYWCFNEAHYNNYTVSVFTKSFAQSAVLISAELIAALALAIIYLTAAGKKSQEGETKLCFKDYIPLELQLIFAVGITAIPLALYSDSAYRISVFSPVTLITLSASAAIAALLGISCAASLARALRSTRPTYKFFICSLIVILCIKLFKLIKRVLEYKPKCFKRNIILIGGAYLFVNTVLIIISAASITHLFPLSVFTFLLCITLNIAVFYFLTDYVDKLDTMIINTVNNTEVENPDTLYRSLQYLANSTKLNNAKLNKAVSRVVKDERLRSELITNVSHDLKTPLTSVITYVDLLSTCNIEDENAREYIAVLSEKSARLKRLIDDLVEASKVTSGAITVKPEKLNLCELCLQSTVDAQEEFNKAGLELIVKNSSEPVNITADGAKAFRIIENLLSNARKYSAPASRVYVSVYNENGYGVFEIKNISAKPLDIDPEELTRRFVRGDKSRSEEGNGLGLSIAKELARVQNGELELTIDGDLFKARVRLPKA